MYPNEEKDTLIKLAEMYKGNPNPTGNPTQAPSAPQLEKGMGGQMMDMAKQRAMTGTLDKGQEGLMEGLGALTAGPTTAQTAGLNALVPATGGLSPGAAQAVMGNTSLAGTTGAQLASGAAGSGAMAGMATAMPYVGAGILAGKALGLFNSGGHVGPLSPQYNAEGTTGFEGITGGMPSLMKILFEHRARNEGIDGDIRAAQEAQRKRNEMYDEWDYQMYGNPGWGGGYHNTGSSGPIPPTPMPRPLLGDMNELQGPMVDPWAGSKVRPAIDGGMPVQPMPMPMPRPRQIDMDMETLRNEYIKSLGE